jgi:two-component sensor histidine kinase
MASWCRYVGEVCNQLMISSGRPGITCSVKAMTGLVLPPDAAVPMALILAEALANAMEHGFVDREAGRVDVVLEHEADQMTLQVRDNGAGLPADFDIGKADSLGLRISRVLSRQLGATYVLEDAGPGCRMCLTLPSARFAPQAA